MRRARIICRLASVLLLALLVGCSTVKLAYNNAPELLYWWIDSYVDLDDAQSPRVRTDLAKLAQWHRSQELPQIEPLLQQARVAAAGEVTPAQACRLFGDAQQRLREVLREAEGPAVALAMSLNAEQLAHLQARFDRQNREWRETWVEAGAEKRLSQRLKSARERSEDFYGSLQEPQLALLRQALARIDFDLELMQGERLRGQRELMQALRRASGQDGRAAATPAEVARLLRSYVDHRLASPDAAYRAWIERLTANSCQLVADLHATASSAQRERAVRRLSAYARDLSELMSPR